jgi:hypothetical protein
LARRDFSRMTSTALVRGSTNARRIGSVGAQPALATRWDLGVFLMVCVLLLTIFEGAARKWSFADNPAMRYASYAAKDVVFMILALVCLKRGRRFDLTWLGICAILILVPSLPGTLTNSNLVGAMLSIRAYLIIPLCAFLAVPVVRTFVDIERCAMAVALASIPVAALGVIQYRLPPTHVLNRYDAADAPYVASNIGLVRATGTFAYLAGMTTMSVLSAWAGIILVGNVPGRKRMIRFLGIAAIIAGGVCAAVSMSRGAVLGWGITCVGATLLYLRASSALFLVLAGTSALGTLILIRPGENFENAFGARSIVSGVVHRFTLHDTIGVRLMMIANEFAVGVGEFPFGVGLGLGQPGGLHSIGLKMERFIESEWGRIAYEVGVLGLIGALVPRAVAAWLMWRGLRSTTNPTRRLVLAAALPMFCFCAFGTMAFNHTGNTAAWAVVALSLPAALPERGQAGAKAAPRAAA